ncbi:MAG: 7-cyano-7-deazaguanine synthase [Sneathiella sp.]|uniref:7-cyano-7-deazaguanine synthase n=1 Tax=Sneathiella sp. TaxID=1964365 RepID=UPI00300287D4
MPGAAKSPEHHVRCLEPIADASGDEQLRFEIDGHLKGVTVQIASLTRSLVSSLPDHVIDLIEIASFIYAIDASISRGGLMDQKMGAKWHRKFKVCVPVRDIGLWSRAEVKQSLEETLMFLSGDKFEFTFNKLTDKPQTRERYFHFGDEEAWTPDTVMLFSGGLDSFAGALEEIVEHNNKVALVSHFSATKIKPIQHALQKAMADKLGTKNLKHFQTKVQLKAGTNNEGTHRTRSFLFATLAMTIATVFGKDRISFYENGVVSLNLTPVGNVVGTRATRTTHPQTLTRFGSFFSHVFSKPLRVDNPFFWRTKKEVVEKISRLGLADQIAHTRSCADVHNQTKQYPHCGRCSQCIDRRFAILSAGLERYDPEEAYFVDLMRGSRKAVQDKEVALSYVRSALAFDTLSSIQLEQDFPTVFAVIQYLDEKPGTALELISNLLKRHGAGIISVMNKFADRDEPDAFSVNSLPSLYGDIKRKQGRELFSPTIAESTIEIPLEQLRLRFDIKRKILLIDDKVEVTDASYRLLLELANINRKAAGQGKELLDYPAISSFNLCKRLNLASEETVRRSIKRTRDNLNRKCLSAGMAPGHGSELIENLLGKGYRLKPDLVEVILKSMD